MKEGWKYKKLGEVCNIIGGGTPSKKNTAYYEGNIPWATVRDMNCNVLSKTEFKISEEGFNDSASHIIKKGEIIIATRVGLGKVCKLAQDTAINQDLKGIIPKKYDIIRDFIFYFFKSRAKFIEENGVGATVKGVKIKFVEDLLFPIIPLKEQQRIVSRLDAAFSHIDELKANAQKQLSEARALFQKSLAKAMEPKEGWKEKKLLEITHEKCPISYGIVQQGDHIDGGVPVVRPVDMREKYITRKNLKCTTQTISDSYKRTILRGDEILLSVRGTTGIISLATPELKGCNVNRGIVPLYFKDNFNKNFLYYEMVSPLLQSFFAEKTTGSTLKQINIKDLRLIKLSIPPLSEQQRIVERLDALSALVRELEENQKKIISECDALKQALLRKVFE